eukprot:349801-Chlamydomonas_euryale.AAC.6
MPQPSTYAAACSTFLTALVLPTQSYVDYYSNVLSASAIQFLKHEKADRINGRLVSSRSSIQCLQTLCNTESTS